jgi:hypothetical protein
VGCLLHSNAQKLDGILNVLILPIAVDAAQGVKDRRSSWR